MSVTGKTCLSLFAGGLLGLHKIIRGVLNWSFMRVHLAIAFMKFEPNL